jgi:hypothetical protein
VLPGQKFHYTGQSQHLGGSTPARRCLQLQISPSNQKHSPIGYPSTAGALKAAGGTLADVVALRIYIVNYQADSAQEVGEALREFFSPANAPASTWVGVVALAVPDFLIEIEAIAVLD